MTLTATQKLRRRARTTSVRPRVPPVPKPRNMRVSRSTGANRQPPNVRARNLNLQDRTLDNIQRALASTSITPRSADSYLACRLSPFMGGNTKGIPDAGNMDFLPADCFTFDDIQLNTGDGFLIQTVTALPYTAMIKGKGGAGVTAISVNGQILTNTTDALNWYPIGIPTPYKQVNFSAGTTVNDPYFSATARLVAVGYKLTYTGITVECSGIVSVSPNTVSFAPNGSTTSQLLTLTPGTSTLILRDPSGAGVAAAPLGTTMLNADYQAGPNVYIKDTVQLRPEVGLYILPKHRSNNFKVYPTLDTPMGVTSNQNSAPAAAGIVLNSLVSSLAIGGTPYTPGVIWYDPDWSGYLIEITGVQSGTSFRLETAWCMEYVPQSGSITAAFTMKSSPSNPRAIQRAQTIINALPTAVPHSQIAQIARM